MTGRGVPLCVGHDPLEICLRDQTEDALLCPRHILRGKTYRHMIIAIALLNGYRLCHILCGIVRIASPFLSNVLLVFGLLVLL